MQSNVDAALRPLLGKPMIGSSRAVDMEMFWFGRPVEYVDRRGGGGVIGEYRFHVQCSWRIRRSGRIVVGYSDMTDPPSDWPGARFDPNESQSNHRDELLDAYHRERNHDGRKVVALEATDWGDVRLLFDDDSALELFPDAMATDTEFWRLLMPNGTHLVMSGAGLERIDSQKPDKSAAPNDSDVSARLTPGDQQPDPGWSGVARGE